MRRSVCFLYKGELTNGIVFRQEDMKSWVKVLAVEIDRNQENEETEDEQDEELLIISFL